MDLECASFWLLLPELTRLDAHLITQTRPVGEEIEARDIDRKRIRARLQSVGDFAFQVGGQCRKWLEVNGVAEVTSHGWER